MRPGFLDLHVDDDAAVDVTAVVALLSGAVPLAAFRRIHGEGAGLLPGYRQDADEGERAVVIHRVSLAYSKALSVCLSVRPSPDADRVRVRRSSQRIVPDHLVRGPRPAQHRPHGDLTSLTSSSLSGGGPNLT